MNESNGVGLCSQYGACKHDACKRLILRQKPPLTGRAPQHTFESFQLQAKHMFLQDTIILTPDSTSVSQGHYANLASLLDKSRDSVALDAAVNAVSLASLGTRFRSFEAKRLAAVQYALSIRRIRESIDSTHEAACLITCISLLSLYEILIADSVDSLNCIVHVQGILAVMRAHANSRPTSAIESLMLSTDAYDIASLKTPSPRSATSNNIPLSDLASIFTKVAALFNKTSVVLRPRRLRLESQLMPLREEACSLRLQLLSWASTQPPSTRPVSVKRFTQPYALHFPDCPELRCPTHRADNYPDYLIANMWTSYRQCQLHLANLICRFNAALSSSLKESNTKRETEKLRKEIDGYIDDVCSSIPFMLAADTIRYFPCDGATWHVPRPPMLLGGLSMQWVLFAIATLESAPETSKSHAREILSWFGVVLGIGQAGVLSNMHENPSITASGDALRWSGFLL